MTTLGYGEVANSKFVCYKKYWKLLLAFRVVFLHFVTLHVLQIHFS